MSKILVIDSNPIDQLIALQALQHNYSQDEIVVMGNTLAAIEYLDAPKRTTNLPSFLLIALEEPETKIFEFLDHFNDYPAKIKKACKIVVLFSWEAPHYHEQLAAYPNVWQLLLKPLNADSLIAAT